MLRVGSFRKTSTRQMETSLNTDATESIMADNDPNINENIDENDDFEIDFDDLDPLPTDGTDIEESEHATADIPPVDLLDLIANQQAAEARSEIFRSLYSKVGERIEGIKASFKGTSPDQ